MRARTIALMLATAAACACAAPPDAGPASSFATAAPAPTIDDEYDLIEATPCICGGAYVPYSHNLEYGGDVIYEVILTRCAQCREESAFFFDLTPRFGKLSEFREAKLATRDVAGEGDLPCPTAESAVAVDSISEEYIFLETTPHSCGEFFRSSGQSLQEDGGHYYDVLYAVCPADGAQAEFFFNVDLFAFNMEKYPEMTHMARAGEPPAALVGRTLGTAFIGDEAAREKFLAEATHRADGGKLNVAVTWLHHGPDYDYVVAETECEICGSPVRLYLRSGDRP